MKHSYSVFVDNSILKMEERIMILTGLKSLHVSMLKNKLVRSKFNFRFKNATFKCLFFTDENPFLLILAIEGTDFFLKLNVEKGYRINTYIDRNKYYELKRLLGLTKKGDELSTKDFFEIVNSKFPVKVDVNNPVYTYETADYVSFTEEKDKIYFYRWYTHDGVKSNVSLENLDKTKKLIGTEAFEICRRKNITSQWKGDKKYQFRIPKLPE